MAETKKFSPLRWTAATEEAAVEAALQIVGATREDAEYEVLARTEKGVTVRVRPRSAEAPVPPVVPVAVEAAPVETAPVETASVEIAAVTEFVAVETEDWSDEDDDSENDSVEEAEASAEVGDLDELEELDEESEEYQESGAFEAAPVAAKVESAESAAGPLDPGTATAAVRLGQEFLERMGLEAQAVLGEGGNAGLVPLLIEGPDVGILIGKHGQTLQAFQYLLNLTINNGNDPEHGVRIVVDAGNYRARRQSSLEQSARAAAAKARREKRPIRLDPMPSHERRLVHMFLQSEPDITTVSEGREPMRRIVINPAGVRPGTPSRGFGERTYTGDAPRRGFGGYGGPRGGSNGGGGGGRGFNRGR